MTPCLSQPMLCCEELQLWPLPSVIWKSLARFSAGVRYLHYLRSSEDSDPTLRVDCDGVAMMLKLERQKHFHQMRTDRIILLLRSPRIV